MNMNGMFGTSRPEIAIIDPNTLTCLGLENLLQEIIPVAVIRTFGSFQELIDDTPDMYAHYFVATQIYFNHTAFFLKRKYQTIVLCNGDNIQQLKGVLTLNICQDQQHLAKSILMLHNMGHGTAHGGKMMPPTQHPGSDHPAAMADDTLSPREIEVLSMVARGMMNKEIADRLCISLTTVITHRKNITEKLGIKTVSGLTIYAVMHGYIEADSI